MIALWIRVDAHFVDSLIVAQVASELRIEPVHAVGHLTAMAGKIAQHTESGHISDVPDTKLEEWACWTRRRGEWARVCREILQDDDGRLKDWLDTMGKLVDRRVKDRKRKQLEKDQRAREESGQVDAFLGTSEEIPRNESGISVATKRDVTERNEKTGRDRFSRATHGNDNIGLVEAGELVQSILACKVSGRTPAGGGYEHIDITAVDALGDGVKRAYLAIGGAKRFLAATGSDIAFLNKDFARALSEIRSSLSPSATT